MRKDVGERKPRMEVYLQADLERLATAADESSYEHALIDAATRVQDFVLANPTEDLTELLSALPHELQPLLGDVIDQAISTHVLQDGSVLRLWTLPVLLDISGVQREAIGSATGLPFLRLSAALHSDLQMAGTHGWANAFPVLLSDMCRRQISLARLIEIPRQTRQAIRGSARMPVLNDVKQFVDLPGRGIRTYHLPFVSFHPMRGDVVPAAASPELIRRVQGWIFSAADECVNGMRMVWIGKPRPYSQEAETGYASWPFSGDSFPELGRH
jgi:hypothetical protein